jgi:type I restriction enzyme S subunit
MGYPIFTIGQVCEFVLDGTHGSPVRAELGIPVLSAQNVNSDRLNFETDRFTTEAEYKNYARRFQLGVGDVLLTIVGTIGRAAIVEKVMPLVFQRSVAILRPKTNLITSKFLFHLTQSKQFKLQLDRYTNKSAQAGIYLGKLKEINFPLPPLAEQKRIAAILDKAAEIKAKREQAIAKLDELAQSTFVEMFGDPVTNSKAWKIVRLGDQTTKLGSGSTPSGGDASYKSEGIGLIRSLNVHDGKFVYKNLAFIDDQQAKKLSNVVVEKDDVLLNITGASVARVCRVPANVLPARVNQHVMIVRPTELLNSTFLEKLLLNAQMKTNLLRIGGAGATREAITKAQAEELQIICPPQIKQKEFAAFINSLEIMKERELDESEKLDALFQSLQHQAFTTGFTA